MLVFALQDEFLAAVQAEGWPPEGVPRQTRIFDDHAAPVLERRERVAIFLVDLLRYEMGRDLGEALAGAGEAADCEARDEKTREVTLQANKETPVPVLIDPDFDGPQIEVRVSDPRTRVVWARRKLKNAMMG